ncbi:hypothetical protein MTYM_02021 [Methylococcales bacterium]|nr:hypothetical protein MTYM_02021 [Methylococcales bacterium]
MIERKGAHYQESGAGKPVGKIPVACWGLCQVCLAVDQRSRLFPCFLKHSLKFCLVNAFASISQLLHKPLSGRNTVAELKYGKKIKGSNCPVVSVRNSL